MRRAHLRANTLRWIQNCQSAVNYGKDEDTICTKQWKIADRCKIARNLSVAVDVGCRTALNTKLSKYCVWCAPSIQHFLFPCSACSFAALKFTCCSFRWVAKMNALPQRIVTAIHSAAVDRLRNLPIERWTLCHWAIVTPKRFWDIFKNWYAAFLFAKAFTKNKSSHALLKVMWRFLGGKTFAQNTKLLHTFRKSLRCLC